MYLHVQNMLRMSACCECILDFMTCLQDMLGIMHVRAGIHYFGSKLFETLSSLLTDANHFRLHWADAQIWQSGY